MRSKKNLRLSSYWSVGWVETGDLRRDAEYLVAGQLDAGRVLTKATSFLQRNRCHADGR